MDQENQVVTVDDLHEAAWLRASGIDPVGRRMAGDRMVWEFPASDRVADILKTFHKRGAGVEFVLRFGWCRERELKSIFSLRRTEGRVNDRGRPR